MSLCQHYVTHWRKWVVLFGARDSCSHFMVVSQIVTLPLRSVTLRYIRLRCVTLRLRYIMLRFPFSFSIIVVTVVVSFATPVRITPCPCPPRLNLSECVMHAIQLYYRGTRGDSSPRYLLSAACACSLWSDSLDTHCGVEYFNINLNLIKIQALNWYLKGHYHGWS